MQHATTCNNSRPYRHSKAITMEDIYYLIQERNARETLPFISIHSSNAYLRNFVDTLQARCEPLERQYLEQQQLVAEQQQTIDLSVDSAPAKTEARLRDQISKLQEELRKSVQKEVKAAAEALERYNELSMCKESRAAQDTIISNLQIEATRNSDIITHLQSELENSNSLARLAEKQINGLKDAIRSLQDENDELTKLNKRMLDETVSDKEKMAEQLNNMNDTIETLQKEVNMLRSYVKMGKGPIGNWFGSRTKGVATDNVPNNLHDEKESMPKRQWDASATAVLPSQPQFVIKAHRDDAVCVRYDGTNLNRVATASSDATVKVFNTSNGQLEATFSAGGGHPLIGVDIAGEVVCGCGADKTCR
jgi:autophagy-related protein 16